MTAFAVQKACAGKFDGSRILTVLGAVIILETCIPDVWFCPSSVYSTYPTGSSCGKLTMITEKLPALPPDTPPPEPSRHTEEERDHMVTIGAENQAEIPQVADTRQFIPILVTHSSPR